MGKVRTWLIEQLDRMGIDSEVYGPYVMGILHDGDSEPDIEDDVFDLLVELCEDLHKQELRQLVRDLLSLHQEFGDDDDGVDDRAKTTTVDDNTSGSGSDAVTEGHSKKGRRHLATSVDPSLMAFAEEWTLSSRSGVGGGAGLVGPNDLTDDDRLPEPCRYHFAGGCQRGNACDFSHSEEVFQAHQALATHGISHDYGEEPYYGGEPYAYADVGMESQNVEAEGPDVSSNSSFPTLSVTGTPCDEIDGSMKISDSSGSKWAAIAAAPAKPDALGHAAATTAAHGGPRLVKGRSAKQLGSYFAPGLVHPSTTFESCKHAKNVQDLLECMQHGLTTNGTPFLSVRGFPKQEITDSLGSALDNMRLSGTEREIVVVTGVGGTDNRTNSHKHSSHTKGGSADEAAATVLQSHGAVLSITPLYTQDKVNGNGQKYFGSYLVKLNSR